jgi:hypothetical protein
MNVLIGDKGLQGSNDLESFIRVDPKLSSCQKRVEDSKECMSELEIN